MVFRVMEAKVDTYTNLINLQLPEFVYLHEYVTSLELYNFTVDGEVKDRVEFRRG
jgi:hypothetical protein